MLGMSKKGIAYESALITLIVLFLLCFIITNTCVLSRGSTKKYVSDFETRVACESLAYKISNLKNFDNALSQTEMGQLDARFENRCLSVYYNDSVVFFAEFNDLFEIIGYKFH